MNHLKEVNVTQVLIIGAGISGLEAACLLRQDGISALVLEARNRTGGRIWSIRSKSDLMLDLGASYIHGNYGSIPSGLLTNPLWDRTREAKIPTRKTERTSFLGSYPVNITISHARHVPRPNFSVSVSLGSRSRSVSLGLGQSRSRSVSVSVSLGLGLSRSCYNAYSTRA